MARDRRRRRGRLSGSRFDVHDRGGDVGAPGSAGVPARVAKARPRPGPRAGQLSGPRSASGRSEGRGVDDESRRQVERDALRRPGGEAGALVASENAAAKSGWAPAPASERTVSGEPGRARDRPGTALTGERHRPRPRPPRRLLPPPGRKAPPGRRRPRRPRPPPSARRRRSAVRRRAGDVGRGRAGHRRADGKAALRPGHPPGARVSPVGRVVVTVIGRSPVGDGGAGVDRGGTISRSP